LRWSYNEVLQAFIGALGDAGIPPDRPDSLILDGHTRYYKIAGQKGAAKHGVYKVYFDDCPAGYFKSLRAGDGVDVTNWCMIGKDETLSEEERGKRAMDWERQREQREKKEAEARAKAMENARLMWRASTDIDPKEAGRYLKKKGLSGTYGARQFGADIIIPLTDGREIQTVQTISPDGATKLFLKDAPKRGNFFHIPRSRGEEAEPPEGVEADFGKKPEGEDETPSAKQFKKYMKRRLAWICEGFATGATLRELSGWDVICAIDAVNMTPVARKIRELHPDWTIVVAPDWDREHGNTGISKGLKVAEEFGLAIVPPIFGDGEKGTDWNDLFLSRGRALAQAALREGLKTAFSKPELPEAERENLFVDVSQAGSPKGTVGNLECLLKYLGITVRYNVIRKEVECEVPGHDYGTDNSLNAAFAWVTSECVKYGLPKSEVDPYLMNIASRNYYNPVLDWIKSVKWDGRAHIDSLIDTIECPLEFPDDMKTILITKWLISGVAAASAHGKFSSRGVLVLQGEQGGGKTSWFRHLCPRESNWFGEGLILDPSDKDSLKQFVSHWIVELGEFEGTLRKTDIARLKSFITKETDLVRLPWARKMSEFSRRSILCASVNQQEVLIDITGNSRWWVVPCLRIDYEHNVDVQQVWAEAYVRYRENPVWWLTPDEEKRLTSQNRSFEANDPVEELLYAKLRWDDAEYLWEPRTATEILMECGLQNPTRGQATSASIHLRRMGAKPAPRSSADGARLISAPVKKSGSVFGH
jgi:putative DNA primase/helicase